EADHVVYSGKISKVHATIDLVDGRLVIRDLESTNGTFVNGQQVTKHTLEDGDIIHIAHVEFCLRHAHGTARADTSPTDRLVEQTQHLAAQQRHSVIRGTELLRELIDKSAAE